MVTTTDGKSDSDVTLPLFYFCSDFPVSLASSFFLLLVVSLLLFNLIFRALKPTGVSGVV